MSWQIGLLLVVILACVVPFVVAQIIHDFGTQDDWDYVAEQKRRNAKKARHLSREYR
jgi:hypothetical protein